jgi:tRNA threonylcarbamoyl adenosine modification protein (Sua5/YciO/YrdC/YwlC family)
MSTIFDCSDESQLLAGMRHARQAIGRGDLIVMPTDTVYGVAADAFSPAAVQKLLDAKGRGRNQPPPVLIGSKDTLYALAESVPEAVQKLVDAFWPGGLTIVLPAQPSLVWDLGETLGTVAVRMPEGRVALELLAETGPLAVSSANLTGKDAAISAHDAEQMLGESVAVYLADGMSKDGIASTIIDATSLVRRMGDDPKGGVVRILRHGVVTRAQLEEVLGDLLEPEAKPADDAEHGHEHEGDQHEEAQSGQATEPTQEAQQDGNS